MRPIEQEIVNKMDNIEFRLAKLIANHINEIFVGFEEIEQQISENLTKLRLGGIQDKIKSFTHILLKNLLDNFKVINSKRLNEIKLDVKEDINQIFTSLTNYVRAKEDISHYVNSSTSKKFSKIPVLKKN